MKNYLIKKWKKWHEYPEPSNKYCPCEDGVSTIDAIFLWVGGILLMGVFILFHFLSN